MLVTNLGTVWKLLRSSWCPLPHANLIEEITERVRLSPTKDEGLKTPNVIHKLVLPHNNEPGEIMNKLEFSMKKMEPGSCLEVAEAFLVPTFPRKFD